MRKKNYNNSCKVYTINASHIEHAFPFFNFCLWMQIYLSLNHTGAKKKKKNLNVANLIKLNVGNLVSTTGLKT